MIGRKKKIDWYISSGEFIDPDAQLFFTAVEDAGGELSEAERTEWNNSVLLLRSVGLWDDPDFIAFYPMLGGTEASCAINAKTPGTFTLDFIATVAGDFTSLGWKPNGSTSYAKTGIIPSTTFSANKFTGYYYSNDHVQVTGVTWGAKVSATQTIQCLPFKADGNFTFDFPNETTGRLTADNALDSAVGGTAFSRISTTKAWFQIDEVLRNANNNTVASGSHPNIELYLAAVNLTGSPLSFYSGRCAGAGVMNGWSANKIAVFNSIITLMNIRLNRAQNRHYYKGQRFIVPNSKSLTARDNEEAFSGTLFLKDTTLYHFYGGSSENLVSDRDSVMLATKSKTGYHDEPWTKYGDPTPLISYTTAGTEAWDGWDNFPGQIVDMGDGTYRMYYGARDQVPETAWGIGIATSSDLITWTKLSANNPVLTGHPFCKVIKDGSTWHMIASTAANVHNYYDSSDGITWTLQGSNIMSTDDGRVGDIFKYNNKFYLLVADTTVSVTAFAGSALAGQARADIRMKETEDFVTFTNRPFTVFSRRLAEEYGVTAVSGLVQVDDSKWIGIYTSYRPTVAKTVGSTNDTRTASKLFLINNADFTQAQSINTISAGRFFYPYFISHIFNVADQGRDLFYNHPGTWMGLGSSEGAQKFTDFTGRSIKFADPVKILNTDNFGVKLRTRITADDTAYQPLCGQWSATESERAFLIYFEDGKLKVNIYSQNGEQKLYTSTNTNLTDLLDENDGIDDAYDTIDVGFTYQDGTLKLCCGLNANIDVTKTTDEEFTDGIRTSTKDFVIGEDYEGTGNNADRVIRSVHFLCDATESNWLEIDL